jgi:hypothetical protein
MASPNVPFNQLPKEAQRRVRRENPESFPLKDTRPARDVDTYRDTTSTSAPQPVKQGWREKVFGAKEKIQAGAEKGFGKVQKFAQNHPMNNPPDAHKSPKREPNKANWKEPKEPRGRVSSRDIYKDGVLVERVHYGPAHPPSQKQPKPRRGRRDDPLGGLGAGMTFRDMMPSSNQGFGLGGMMSEPYGAPAPRPRKGKKGRRSEPREEPFDYLEHISSFPKPWKGKF